MTKYIKLHQFLSNITDNQWSASFSKIESILGFSLPQSARKHAAWWGNAAEGHSHAEAWLEAGWETENLNLTAERVAFRRTGPRSTTPKLRAKRTPKPSLSAYDWDTPDQLQCDISMQWQPLGRIISLNGRLSFPIAPSSPGLYRFRVRQGNREAVYYGESDNLARRFTNYRNPGSTQQTNVRVNQKFTEMLERGAEISVAVIIQDAWICRDGKRVVADFSSKAVRRLFEHAAIHASGEDIEALNR
ncbi:hypothetical protein [Ferrovibrio sp.]|uniref:DUF7662 domain-containing protein n=1 Tax=Ferrovibrio sp. TaxID=1917215 RepID=UPI000CBAADAC|nr:hypothetical protein [Ferrovibrio sp.]PJI42160.1 MAG: hypothetical protein CTR53_06885 [Ferrovibrio sp.]